MGSVRGEVVDGRPRRGSLRRRIVTVTSSLAIGALLLGGFSAWTAWQARDAVHREQTTLLPAAVQTQSLLASMVNQETGERGYLLTTQPVFLQPYTSGLAATARLTKRMEAGLRSYPQTEALLAQVTAAYQAWLTQTAMPEIADVRAGDQQAAVAAEATGAGKDNFDMLRQRVSALSSNMSALLRSSEHRERAKLSAALTLTVILTLAALAAAILGRVLLQRLVAGPVDQLAGHVRAVAAGDLDHQIDPTGPAELAQLGRDVEAMRRRLRDELEDARQSREALEQREPVMARLRDVLAPSLATGGTGVTVAGRLVPAEGVLAGDWYDVLEVRPGVVAAAIVDISGHGPEAGIFALQVRQILLFALQLGLAPADAFRAVADSLGETEERFATGIVVLIDVDGGTCTWANAGHPPAVIVAGGAISPIEGTGPLLGPLPGRWSTVGSPVSPGDMFVMWTDGIVEARDREGHEFGRAAVEDVVTRYGPDGPDELAERIVSSVREHTGGQLADDATVLVVAVNRRPTGAATDNAGPPPPEVIART
jgi:serine phosphatase RsbU (regulator of sigma subunit)/CHASE3 domain sensor protein